jgi:hypothetical protein
MDSDEASKDVGRKFPVLQRVSIGDELVNKPLHLGEELGGRNLKLFGVDGAINMFVTFASVWAANISSIACQLQLCYQCNEHEGEFLERAIEGGRT